MVRAEPVSDRSTQAARLRALYAARSRAELDAAEEVAGGPAVRWSGDPLARTMFVKGAPGLADTEAGAAFAGPDGEAASRAMAALGRDGEGILFTCSRPPVSLPESDRYARLAAQIEAADPEVVVAADPDAAADVACSLGIATLVPGQPAVAGGRVFLALSGLEDSLGDEGRKRVVWGQLKSLARSRPG